MPPWPLSLGVEEKSSPAHLGSTVPLVKAEPPPQPLHLRATEHDSHTLTPPVSTAWHLCAGLSAGLPRGCKNDHTRLLLSESSESS